MLRTLAAALAEGYMGSFVSDPGISHPLAAPGNLGRLSGQLASRLNLSPPVLSKEKSR